MGLAKEIFDGKEICAARVASMGTFQGDANSVYISRIERKSRDEVSTCKDGSFLFILPSFPAVPFNTDRYLNNTNKNTYKYCSNKFRVAVHREIVSTNKIVVGKQRKTVDDGER